MNNERLQIVHQSSGSCTNPRSSPQLVYIKIMKTKCKLCNYFTRPHHRLTTAKLSTETNYILLVHSLFLLKEGLICTSIHPSVSPAHGTKVSLLRSAHAHSNVLNSLMYCFSFSKSLVLEIADTTDSGLRGGGKSSHKLYLYQNLLRAFFFKTHQMRRCISYDCISGFVD